MKHNFKKNLPLFAMVLLASTLTACEVEEVIHGLEEREANEILELLDGTEPPIEAKKMKEDGRIVTYKIVVPARFKIDAYKILNKHELPRRQHKGYSEIFAQAGLIPTKAEEQAKSLAAIQGEVARSLQLIPNVLEAEVNLVIPEENPLANPGDEKSKPSASVTLKYLPINGKPPAEKDEVQRLVAAAVKDLTPERVEVFMALSSKLQQAAESAEATGATGAAACPVTTTLSVCNGDKEPVRLMGRIMCPEAASLFKMLIAIFVVLLLLMSGGLVVLVLRANAVTSKLNRLQAELSSRRRRGNAPNGTGVGMPVPAASGLNAENIEGTSH